MKCCLSFSVNSSKVLAEAMSVGKQFHNLIEDGKKENDSYHKYIASIENKMDLIPYSRIHVIYVLRLCAVGFDLRNVCDI